MESGSDARTCLLVFLGLAAIITFHSAPGMTGGDSCELAVASDLLSIPHYGSSHLYCLVCKPLLTLLSFLPFSVIRLCNLFSAFFLSGAYLIIFVTVNRLIHKPVLAFSLTGFLATSLITTCGFYTEIYSLNLLLFSFSLYCLVRLVREDNPLWFYLTLFCLILGLSLHISNFILLPGLLPVIIHFRKRLSFRKAILAAAIGFTPFLYLLIRGNCDVLWRYGNFTNVDGIYAYLTGAEKNVSSWFFAGGVKSLLERFLGYLRILGLNLKFLLPFPMALIMYRKDRLLVSVFFLFALLNSVFYISVPAAPSVNFYFFIPSLICFFLIAANGTGQFHGKWFVKVFPAVLALSMLVNYYQLSEQSFRNNRMIDEWVDNTFRILPDGCSLIVSGDELTFPLLYSQFVENRRTDITVVNRDMAHLAWYSDFLLKHAGTKMDSLDSLIMNREPAVFSDSISKGKSALYSFNSYGHLYKVQKEKKLYISENSQFLKNMILPFRKPLDRGEERIVRLYADAFRNYAIDLARNLEFAEARLFASLSASIARNKLIMGVLQRIENGTELLEKTNLPQTSSREKLRLSLLLENPELIIESAQSLLAETGDDMMHELILDTLWRERSWDRFQKHLSTVKNERIRSIYSLKHSILLLDESVVSTKIREWEEKYGLKDLSMNVIAAGYYAGAGNWKEVEKYVGKLPDSVHSLNIEAGYHYYTGNLIKAASLWRSVLKKEPGNDTALRGLREISGPQTGEI